MLGCPLVVLAEVGYILLRIRHNIKAYCSVTKRR